ncbi:hypothetical protein ONZ45_g17201 [Pleurotus djamor]|nr:hypothetical protein ONZ45_g17201 [Pleurotus djamor]
MVLPLLPQAPALSLFLPSVRSQRRSSEIVIFSPELGTVCEIAYPFWRTRTGPLRINANGLRDYLRRRNVYWACFCSLIQEDPVSCRIVEAETTRITYAFCHYDPPRCGFYMNLDLKYQLAIRESSYDRIATQSPGGEPLAAPAAMAEMVIAHRLLHPADSEGPAYFQDYLGTFGRLQLSSSPAAASRERRREDHRARLSLGARRSQSQPNFSEAHTLRALLQGHGVSTWDTIGLIEMCQHCGEHFAASVLRTHIPGCDSRH